MSPFFPARGTVVARRCAWFVALGADALQVALFPFFGAGFASPANNVLDVAVAVVLIRLLGWHIAFLPTMLAELMPVVDLVPTWTAAVFLATRGAASRPPPGTPAPGSPPSPGG